MITITSKKVLCTSGLLLLMASTANATTLWVNCGARSGLTSINAALKTLKGPESAGANTINVSGACYENVLITDTNGLTIVGRSGASLTDASGDTADVVDIRNSRVTISGMTIDARNNVTWDAVDCEQGSHCMLNGNTIQGGADALGVYATASAAIVGGVLQNATSYGIWARGDVAVAGVLIQGNPQGIGAIKGGRLQASIADPAWNPIREVTQTTIAGNTGTGVQVVEGAQFLCGGCVIRDNGGDGIHADLSAATTIQAAYTSSNTVIPPLVTRNAGPGVYVGDLSSAAFHGPNPTVTLNGQPDIVCKSALSVSRGALGAAGSAHTNCAN